MFKRIEFFVALLAVSVWAVGQKRPPNFSPDAIPETNFSCEDKITGGYYADIEADCQLFHVCVQVTEVEYQDFRFLCPNHTVFDQQNLVCTNWFEVDCQQSLHFFAQEIGLREPTKVIQEEPEPPLFDQGNLIDGEYNVYDIEEDYGSQEDGQRNRFLEDRPLTPIDGNQGVSGRQEEQGFREFRENEENDLIPGLNKDGILIFPHSPTTVSPILKDVITLTTGKSLPVKSNGQFLNQKQPIKLEPELESKNRNAGQGLLPVQLNRGEFITEDRSKDPFKYPPVLSADGKKPCVKSNIKASKDRGLCVGGQAELDIPEDVSTNDFVPAGDIIGNPIRSGPEVKPDGRPPRIKSNIIAGKKTIPTDEAPSGDFASLEDEIQNEKIGRQQFDIPPRKIPKNKSKPGRINPQDENPRSAGNLLLTFEGSTLISDDEKFTNPPDSKFVDEFDEFVHSEPEQTSHDGDHLRDFQLESDSFATPDPISQSFITTPTTLAPFDTSFQFESHSKRTRVKSNFGSISFTPQSKQNFKSQQNQVQPELHPSSKCDGNPFKCPPKKVVDGKEPRVKSNIKASTRNFYHPNKRNNRIGEKPKPDRATFNKFLANFKARKGKESPIIKSESDEFGVLSPPPTTTENLIQAIRHQVRTENDIAIDSGDFESQLSIKSDHTESPDIQLQNQVQEQVTKKSQKSRRPIQSRRQRPFTKKFPRKMKNFNPDSQNLIGSHISTDLHEDNIKPNDENILDFQEQKEEEENANFQIQDVQPTESSEYFEDSSQFRTRFPPLLRPEPVASSIEETLDFQKNFEIENQSWDSDVITTTNLPSLTTASVTSGNLPVRQNKSRNLASDLLKILEPTLTEPTQKAILVVEDDSDFEAGNEGNFEHVLDSESPDKTQDIDFISKNRDSPGGRHPRVKSNLRFQNTFGRKKIIAKKKKIALVERGKMDNHENVHENDNDILVQSRQNFGRSIDLDLIDLQNHVPLKNEDDDQPVVRPDGQEPRVKSNIIAQKGDNSNLSPRQTNFNKRSKAARNKKAINIKNKLPEDIHTETSESYQKSTSTESAVLKRFFAAQILNDRAINPALEYIHQTNLAQQLKDSRQPR